MVRGKKQTTAVKPQTTRKSASKVSTNTSAQSTPPNVSAQSPQCSSDKTLLLATVPACCGCGKAVTDDTPALHCDKCMAVDAWKCAECLNLSSDLYDRLVSDTNMSIRWFCDNCDKMVMAKNNDAECHDKNDKLDHLIAVIEKLVSRYEDIERQLVNKCGVDEVSKLDIRIQQLEQQLSNQNSDTESKLSALEEQLKRNSVDVNVDKERVSDEDMIKFVQEEISKKAAEDQDMEKRKRNIIIYRVPEKTQESVMERKTSDTVFVKDLLDCVFNVKLEDDDIDRMYRLGRLSDDKTRPLLVGFKSVEMKEKITTNLRNLRQTADKFRGIGISQDLHPREREEIKSMIAEAKNHHTANSTEQVENFRFLVVGQGQRKKVIKIKKNSNQA